MEQSWLPRITWGGILVWVGCPIAGAGFFELGADLLDYLVPAFGGTLALPWVLFWAAIAAVGSVVVVIGDRARRRSLAPPFPA